MSREGETPLVRELLCPEALRTQALESLCKALGSRELRLALPGAEPADGLRTEPMMMARETAEIGLPGEIYTPLAMDGKGRGGTPGGTRNRTKINLLKA